MLPSMPSMQYQIPAIRNGLEKCPSISDIRDQCSTPINLQEMWSKVPNVWYRCPKTNKPEVCSENLLKLSAMIGSAVAVSGVAGYYYFFPSVGFSGTGPAAKSFAAAWQSTIGNVSPGSIFSACQSLSMTGTGALVAGGASAGLALLASAVAAKQLDWCTCQYDMQQNNLK